MIIGVPCYVIRSRDRTFLLDAYFVKHLEYPPRRALLIFPTTARGLANKPTAILEPMSFNEVLNLFRESFEISATLFAKVSKQLFTRYRLSFALPLPRSTYRDKERELEEISGAIRLLSYVFGKPIPEAFSAIQNLGVDYIELRVKNVENRGIELSSRDRHVAKVYSWLWERDRAFRDALSSILEES